MKRLYGRAFDPPAPVVPVRLRAPGQPDAAHADGTIDSGSDLCAIPDRLVAALDLPPVRSVRARGFAGAPVEVPVYRVDLEVDGFAFPRVEALPTARPYVLVGRNVLRRLVVRLDGPRELLVTLDPHHPQSGWVDVPLDELGLDADRPFQVHDQLSDASYLWHGARNFVALDPAVVPAHVFLLRRRLRTEQDFDYFL